LLSRSLMQALATAAWNRVVCVMIASVEYPP
jgi:hypothetical protein